MCTLQNTLRTFVIKHESTIIGLRTYVEYTMF